MLAWLKRAAHQAEAINHQLLQNLPVTQVQLDEMWNFIARKHARETDEAGESLPEGQDGRQWIWVSFAPEFRWMIAAVVGPRTLETAKEVVAATKARVAGIPAFFSDGFTCYLAALIAAFHVVMTFAPTGKRGPPPQARLCPTSRSDLWAVGQTEEARQAADAQHPRRAGRRTFGAPGPHDQHRLGRTGAPDLAPGFGAIGSQDIELLQRPRTLAAAGGLLSGLL